jgi:hypothetical protein
MSGVPELELTPLKNGTGYFVLVTWPDGQKEQVEGFSSEAAARTWIEKHSSDWLARHPKMKKREV